MIHLNFSDLVPFLQETEQQLLVFFSTTLSTVTVNDPQNVEYKRRTFCDGYIQQIRQREEARNREYESALKEVTSDFDLRKQELQRSDIREFHQQKGICTALKAQEFVLNELNEFFGFSHLPFCPLFDEGQNFVSNRWFRVLSKTPYPPDFKPVTEQEAADFKDKLFGSVHLDSCLFDPDSAETPLIKRFVTHLLAVKDTYIIAPILDRYNVHQEIIQDFSAARQLEVAVAIDRQMLLINELLDAVKIFSELQKRVQHIERTDGVLSLFERGFKKLCSISFLVTVSIKKDFTADDTNYAKILRERVTSFAKQSSIDSIQHSGGHRRTKSLIPMFKSLSIGAEAAAPVAPAVLCLETPMPKQLQTTGAAAASQTVKFQECHQKAELYNRLQDYQRVFKESIAGSKKFFPPNHETVRATEAFLKSIA